MDSLFADSEVGPGTVAGWIGGVIGLATAAWTIIRQFIKDRNETRAAEKEKSDKTEKEKKVDTIAELKGILDIHKANFESFKTESKADIARLQLELDASELRSHECDRRTDRMASHIFYIEDIIRRLNPDAKFRSWAEVEAGSGHQEPIKVKVPPVKESP